MHYLDQWRAIGLGGAAVLDARYRVRTYDTGGWRYLRAQGGRIMTALEEFKQTFEGALPEGSEAHFMKS